MSATAKTKPAFRRPAGWKANPGSKFYTKDSVYGVRYMCKTCGEKALGLGNREHNHLDGCEAGLTHAMPLPRGVAPSAPAQVVATPSPLDRVRVELENIRIWRGGPDGDNLVMGHIEKAERAITPLEHALSVAMTSHHALKHGSNGHWAGCPFCMALLEGSA